MKLSPTHRDIIRCALHRGSLSVQEMSEHLPYKAHVIRHSLDQLLKNKVLRKTVFCDVYKLGYTPNNLHFSLAMKEARFKQPFIDAVRVHPQVLWFAEIAGSLQYELTFLSRNIREFSDFIDLLSDQFGEVFEKKALAVEVCHNYFGSKFISSCPVSVPPIKFEVCEQQHKLDLLDAEIMHSLCVNGDRPLSALARSLKVSLTTLTYRKKRLRDTGVLLEEIYLLNRAAVVPINLNLMVSVARGDLQFRRAFMKFCTDHPIFICCHRCVGDWDYKIGLEGETRESIVTALEDMKSRFSSHLAAVEVVTVLREFKNDFFPFDRAASQKSPAASSHIDFIETPPRKVGNF